jgi:hypothetical protein
MQRRILGVIQAPDNNQTLQYWPIHLGVLRNGTFEKRRTTCAYFRARDSASHQLLYVLLHMWSNFMLELLKNVITSSGVEIRLGFKQNSALLL